ncbi:uncharacterized protein A1O5_01030 [Cladophialophora psammophila CBS 110553]|uniref:FAD-binding domain-containing protein n=1 Tax=Cladophialophora psammophila CBS 110553 TaxID=1182543 RepID=W9X7R7_9EURO|nr:uncharacterized protein A1O5_01030 [Cladophialophora psammophila CBS 110553]EXJ76522.1 hypothetical protein A1O5_01030 [Cladophialophora psammophila CBS 110553]
MGSLDEFRVLIIGGGTCGLAIAQGLQKENISYTIFERDSADDYWNKTRDWGMLLHWGKDFLMRMLPEDLKERFKETLVDPAYDGTEGIPIPHVHGETGEVMARIAMPGMVRVSRKKLREFLTSKQDLNISFAKKLVSVESTGASVTAIFDDGSREKGSFMVGCDGSRSKVREYLVGPEAAKPYDTGMTIINHAASGFTPESARLLRKYHPIGTCFYDPEVSGIFLLTILDGSNAEKPETWSFQIHHAWWGAPNAADLKDPRGRLKFFKERSSRICEPFSTAAAALPDDAVLPADPGQQWSPTLWDNHKGTVTIAGDAAHSMLPNRGQGLNNAMQDAAEIVDAVKLAVSGTSPLADAVTAYEDGMRPRGARDVALSLETASKLYVSELRESPMFKVGLQKMDVDGVKVVAVPNAVQLID